MLKNGKIITTNLRASIFRDPIDERDYQFSSYMSSVQNNGIVLASTAIPAKVSHVEEMSPVKYQGTLGSCVAFATLALKEWQEQKEYLEAIKAGSSYRREETSYNLSEQWLYWNCKKIDQWGSSVEGTDIRSAMKVLNKIGVPPEDGWPYTDDKVNIGKPESWAPLIARWYTIGSYWRVSSLDEIRAALVEGPVVAGITCFEEMFGTLDHGYIPMPAKPGSIWAYHAVCFVGYDDEAEELIFKNSWSQFWGNRGYGRISYNYANNYLLDAWTARDIQVTPEMLQGTKDLIS